MCKKVSFTSLCMLSTCSPRVGKKRGGEISGQPCRLAMRGEVRKLEICTRCLESANCVDGVERCCTLDLASPSPVPKRPL